MKRFFEWLLVTRLILVGAVGYCQHLSDTLRHADWNLYWHSEFNKAGDSSTVAQQWQFAYPWGRNLGDYEGEYYSGQQVTVDTAGMLHLQAQRRATPRPYEAGNGHVRQLKYESGMLFSRAVRDSTQPNGCGERSGFACGLFEIRCRLPNTPNSFPAFWLYGSPDEIDIFEADGSDLLSNNVILASHDFWRTGPAEGSQSFFYWIGTGHLTDGLHTLALSWQPQELVYYFDGIAIRHETRLLPLGCSLDLIANLAMFSWASAKTASFDIDYIRVYKSRKVSALVPLTPVAPVAGAYQGPRSLVGTRANACSEVSWRVLEQPAKRLRLAMQTNLNPREYSTLPLPYKSHWFAPLVGFNEADSPRHWIVSPDSGRSSMNWTLYDLQGRLVCSGQHPPAAGWEMYWPNLAPGAYCLLFRIGTRQVYQTVYQLGRSANPVFTTEWLAPAADEALK